MDDTSFDNIARRLGGLRSRRAALKTAGGATVAAVLTAIGLENSALAQEVGIETTAWFEGNMPEEERLLRRQAKSKEIICNTSAMPDRGIAAAAKGKPTA